MLVDTPQSWPMKWQSMRARLIDAPNLNLTNYRTRMGGLEREERSLEDFVRTGGLEETLRGVAKHRGGLRGFRRLPGTSASLCKERG